MAQERPSVSPLQQEKDAAFKRLALSTGGAVLGTMAAPFFPILSLPALACWGVSVYSLNQVLKLEAPVTS